MTTEAPDPKPSGTPLRPEVVAGGSAAASLTAGPDPSAESTEAADADGSEESRSESIEQPAKLLRIGSMVKQLLEEVRQAPLDEASRVRLREIYEQSIRELAGGLSPDLVAELDRISIPFDTPTPSDAELRVAHAQLVGWLEGLFHGIQATLVAQQVAARAQLDEMRQRSLPQGPGNDTGRPGTYL
ncbi:MAG TPA: bacterial proteasome activator family protein [Acidimicrobiales bacterium]|nr:bacterial proteasome activator family protein [Acidimicrobiales bacterium]